MIEKQNYKLITGEKFISSKLLENLIRETDVQKAIVEEKHSELWFETLNGYGSIFFNNNVTYQGRVKYGLLETESEDRPSTITFPNGTRYVGTVSDNQITGKGTYFFPKGGEYTGGVLNGLRHGSGVYKSSSGIIYEGEWKQGLKHGKGKITQGDMILEGEWCEGIIEGKARIKWKNGNVYDGDIQDNKMHGNGYIIWYDGNQKYCGQWRNNIQNGFGVFIWFEPRGEQKMLRNRFVGEWVNGKRNGFGMFYYSNGSYYEGYWKNDKKEGFGIFTFPDRKQYIGIFKEDRRIESQVPQALSPNTKTSTSFNNKDVSSISINSSNVGNRSSIRKETSKYNPKETTNAAKRLDIIKESDESKAIIGGSKLNEDKDKDKGNKAEDKQTNTLPSGTGPSSNFRNRIEQSINEIKLVININDLIEIDSEIKSSLKEIDNILLRNLSFITRIYNHALGKESFRDADLVTSTISPSITNETKSQFNNPFGSKQEPQQEEKKESFIEYDCIYNDDLYFCLDLKGLWKLLREVGFITPDFSLVIINRLYFSFTQNYIEMFYIPNTLPHEKIYDYLYQTIHKRKMAFNNKFKKQIDNAYMTLNQENDILNSNSNSNETMISFNEKYDIYQDIHNRCQIILLRHFYEVLIRVAYEKFHTSPMSLDQKLKKLIEILRAFFKAKKKGLESAQFSSISILDIKLKNWEIALESFIFTHEKTLRLLFISIYQLTTTKPQYHDMTIRYSFLYDLLGKSEKMKEQFKDKIAFSEIASFYHKDKLIINQETIKSFNQSDVVKYINTLFNIEMIFYEFMEALFFICKKYSISNKIDEDEDDEALEIINQCVIKYKADLNTSSNSFFSYPHLKTHLMIEKLQREEQDRLLEEQKRKKEIERSNFERAVMQNEDINYYEEDKEHDSESSDY